MMQDDVKSLCGALAGVPVLCVGDIFLDRYIYGDAVKISPEAPVPVLRVTRQTAMPGGMGNVARNLAEWGVLPLAVGIVGQDDNARLMAECFSRQGGLPPIMVHDHSRRTITKTRVIAGIQQAVRYDDEDTHDLSEEARDKLLDVVRRHIAGVKAVTVSDYGKGSMTPAVLAEIGDMARRAGTPVVADPKGSDYSRYAGLRLVTPNTKELAEAAHRQLPEEGDLRTAAEELIAEFGIENILVTRSEKGMMLVKGDADGAEPFCIASKVRRVFDVSGAGDTVVAAMAAALAAGRTLEVGAEFATLAAGVVVGKVGTATATLEEVLSF